MLQVARRRAASIRCLHSWSYLLLKQSFFRLAQGSSPSPCVHPLEPHAKFSFLSLIPFWFATGQGSLLFSFARWLSFHVSRMCVSSHRLSFSGLRLVPSFLSCCCCLHRTDGEKLMPQHTSQEHSMPIA